MRRDLQLASRQGCLAQAAAAPRIFRLAQQPHGPFSRPDSEKRNADDRSRLEGHALLVPVPAAPQDDFEDIVAGLEHMGSDEETDSNDIALIQRLDDVPMVIEHPRKAAFRIT